MMGVRWGIIGCGDVCEQKSGPAFYKLPDSSLTAVMRRSLERAKDFAVRHRVARYSANADDVIFDPEVDAVYIATPPGSHLKYALRVAEACKPCYVEKPMARSAMECRQMIQAFERAGQPLFVAYYRRALPRFTRVKALLESGALGRIISVHYQYCGLARIGSPPEGFWRENATDAGGGLFMDLGCHVLDLLDHLFGPLTLLGGDAERRSAALDFTNPVEDCVAMSFRFGSGILGTTAFAFHSCVRQDELRILGQSGELTCSVFGIEPLTLRVQGTQESIAVPQPDHVHGPLIATIVDELTGKDVRCPSRGRSALRTAEIMDGVLAGFYKGRDDAFWLRPETWRSRDSARTS
jgi:1,5-anhydro-D-fructose reductase (1,5-anhydro-D-mannitol-forming)